MMRERLARTAWSALAAVKNALVSDRFGDRKVWAGPARGAILHTNDRKGTRELLGLYEGELSPWVRRYVRPGDVCYDVGAAGGYHAMAGDVDGSYPLFSLLAFETWCRRFLDAPADTRQLSAPAMAQERP